MTECAWCGNTFHATRTHLRYCTVDCRHHADEARRAAKRSRRKGVPLDPQPYWARVYGDRHLGQRCGHRHSTKALAERCKACKHGHVEYFEP